MSGRYICFSRAPSVTGEIWNRPPLSASSSAANTVGESKWGRHRKSTDPFVPTIASVLRSPMTP